MEASGPHLVSPTSLLPGEQSVSHKPLAMDCFFSFHWVKMGHLINGNHFHSSALREWIIVVVSIFSLFFSSLDWGRDIKCLTLHFLTSSGSQAPFEEELLCNKTFIPKGFLPSFYTVSPRSVGDSAKTFGSVGEMQGDRPLRDMLHASKFRLRNTEDVESKR